MKLPDGWLEDGADELRASVQFLTRLPLGRALPVSGAEIGRAAWAFPITGLLIGLLAAIVYALAHRAGMPSWVAGALAIAATLIATGCLHEDGLADTMDGFGGGDTTERKLEIMRDSRIGTYGVCALVLSILLRAGALAYIADPWRVLVALLAAHAAARATMPALMYWLPPARRDGLAFAAGQPQWERLIAAVVLGSVILLICLGLAHGLAALILLAVVIAVMAWLSGNQIGGQTGDVLGAVEQISEIVILLAAIR
jgi:adenosylcobinamide-GDP ribazoletransferase